MAPAIAVAQPPGEGRIPAESTASGGDQLVSIDFNNVDIGVFVKFISDLTKRNFIIDDKVRGRVTVISPGRITVSEAYRVFESVLEVNGFTTVPSGAVTKIVPAPEARAKSIRTRIEEEAGRPGDNVITQIVPLRYADPNEIKNLFTPLVSRNSVIQAYPPTNTLIITDVHSNIARLLQILKAIDITGVGQQIALIPVQNASSAKLVTMLDSIFRSARERGASEKDITFVSDDRTNTLIILASEGDIDNIRQLVSRLDKETPRGQGNINVYYLEHASSEDMVKVLQEIIQRGGQTADAEGKPVAPAVSDKVRITADKPTNSLIIVADLDEYMVLESIIQKIDIPRSMVYIEALIMEVNVNKDFRLGTEWTLGGETSYDGKDAIYGGGFRSDDPLIGFSQGPTAGSLIPALPGGMSLGIFGEFLEIGGITFPSISAMVQAYQKDRDVRILSTPQILTTDNQEARIYVGKNVPFQTTATASTTGTEIFNSFEYRDVGKSLKITPQISKDRMVRLLISLEVTALEGVATTRPTTLKRTIETTAIVQDGHSVVLGGLIDDNEDAVRYKVPCLGDIPGFGALFSSRASGFEKSNLYVFLTPRVIQDTDEATKVSRQKRQQIEGSLEENIKLYNRNQPMPPAEQL
ncbi:MAG: type II secretion system secretin GspD, partial [Desulfatitalea sp.]|nr:type II secretion system secretin GspD [Desulfatitalea sp.]